MLGTFGAMALYALSRGLPLCPQFADRNSLPLLGIALSPIRADRTRSIW